LEDYYEKDENMEKDKRFVQRKSMGKDALAPMGKNKKTQKRRKNN